MLLARAPIEVRPAAALANAPDIGGALSLPLAQGREQLVRHVRGDVIAHRPRAVGIGVEEALDLARRRTGATQVLQHRGHVGAAVGAGHGVQLAASGALAAPPACRIKTVATAHGPTLAGGGAR